VRTPRLASLVVALSLLAGACSGSDSTSTGARDGDGANPTSSAVGVAGTAVRYPDPEWETADPADHGIDRARLDELHAYLESTRSNCTAVIKDGYLVDEMYWNDFDASTDQEIFSASKSVTSTLVGIAQDQGFLDIDEPASKYITEWQGGPSENVTIRNLISNDSGRYWDFNTDYLSMAAGAEDKTQFAIDLDQQHDPGTVWVYNNSAIQTLQRVLEVATGQDVEDFARANLFEPIGMTSTITRDRAGNPLMFMGTNASCRDLARFGYLALNEGDWDGAQVVSTEWIDEATSPSQELNTIYGFLWWLNSDGRRQDFTDRVTDDGSTWWPDAPLDAFAALGLGSQIVLVVPSENLVVTRIGPFKSDQQAGDTSPNELARILLG
jgi:CubicO group peptidase (beta-lactamase class C family)